MDDIQDVTAIEAKKTSYRNVLFWSSYDAADTLFSQGILSIIFQPLVLLLAFEGGITDYWTAFALMSAFMAVSNLFVAILGPVIGALADTLGRRKPAVLISAGMMCLMTLGFMVWKNFWWLCIMFVFANFAYQVGRMFFDSMIPFISKTDERGKISGISGALSFIGTFFGIFLGMLAYGEGFGIWEPFSEPEKVFNEGVAVEYTGLFYMTAFVVGGIILFAVPFLFSKEKTNPNKNGFRENLNLATKDYKSTFKEIFMSKEKNALFFILGWFFVTDAANTTILYMQLIMIDGAGATPDQALYIIAVGGLLSMVGAILVGRFLDRFGPKKNFIINIISWFIAVSIAIIACIEVNDTHIVSWYILIPVAFFIGIGFGGLWIIGRQFVFEIAPPDKVTQYQGFKQIAGRVSAIISPLMFLTFLGLGKLMGMTQSNQYAFALSPLLLFFVVGYLIIRKYTSVHEEYLSGERAPYKKLQKK